MDILLMPWGRCGSNLLMDIIGQSPVDLVLANEPLTRIATESRDMAPIIVADSQKKWLCTASASDRFELRYFVNLSVHSIVEWDWFVKWAQEERARMIYLDRRNVALTALSAIKAEAYNEAHKLKYGRSAWAVAPGREIVTRPHVDWAQFMAYVDLIERNQNKMKQASGSIPGLEIYYEDILVDLDGLVRHLWWHIGITDYPYAVRKVKAVARPLSEEIANAAELMRHLDDRLKGMLME